MKNSGLRAVIVLILLNISILVGRAQTLPPLPIDPFYDSWSFYDPTNWLSDEGYAPNTFTNIVNDDSAWSSDDGILNCNGLILDSTDPAFLNYKTVENNGHTNLSCTAGTIWFWFSPDWDSESQGGTGPGDWGRFIDVGAYTTNATFGWWSLFCSPDGNNIYFSGQTNGATTNYLNAPISWTTGSWHLIGLTYTPTNSILYIDDQVATNGLGVIYPPGHDVLTNGFWIGSDYSGTEQARGEFVDLESWLIQFPSDEFSAYYDEMAPEFGGGGFHTDSFTPPDFSSGGGGGSYFPDLYGTNLWLYIAGVESNSIGLFLINTTPDISYEIQSKTDLTLTNWFSEGFVLGSEVTNWTEMDVTQGIRTTNLFFRIRSWIDDGSGIPDWWQQQYFGTNGVDPYGDPDGDGWNNQQEFQNGTNPNSFNTPPAPSGLAVDYNSSSNTASVTWLPSPSSVTGYTVEVSDGHTFTFGAGTNNFVDNALTDVPDLFYSGPTIDTTFRVQAHYAGGDSAWSGDVALEQDVYPYYSFSVNLISGSQGSAYLTASALPPGTVALKVTEVDGTDFDSPFVATNFNVSVGSVTNGLYSLPNIMTPPKTNTTPYFYTIPAYCYWYVQAVGANGKLSSATYIGQNYDFPYSVSGIENDYHGWLVPPYFDGRTQLKQNLIFQLRSALATLPFQYTDNPTNGYYNDLPQATTTNYAYAGFYRMDGASAEDGSPLYEVRLNVIQPFAENYADRNFVFNSSELGSNGRTLTGAGGYTGYYGLTLQEPAAYQFQVPTNGATIAALLATNDTRWLASFPLDASGSSYSPEIGITHSGSTNSLASGAVNYFGLPFLSAKIAYTGGNITLNAGNYTTQAGYFYPETAQPKFQTVEYDFWPNMYYIYAPAPTNSFPGLPNFPTANTNVLITSVGAPFQIAGYAKLAVTNSSFSGVYGFLGQYFDKAYQVTNGGVTTNTTGVLSSYGSFFPTQPGAAALVTMPDPDTGARGTGMVYCVSLVLDRNHGSNMDLSFGGANDTSANNPDSIWVNNNYDRGHIVDGSDFEQDDLGPVDIANGHLVPDCQYITNGVPAIPCTRDLEDYFRLWTPGLAAALAAAPTNYTARLTLSGDGQIRIFQAIESNGGTNYLFDEGTASNQVANSSSLYVGLLTSSSPIVLNNRTNEHFIFCGAQTGSAQVDLQILDPSQNVIADAPAYLQISDIKQMYERWTVGEKPSQAPNSVANKAVDGVTTAFQYPSSPDTNTSYILFVHGWNQETWEKDRYAETAFKRLYWQGYRGRFGSFRWPTDYDFGGIGDSWNNPITDPRNFDNSEFTAWQSATGLFNKLNDLNAEYSNNVYIIAHSMGNVVTGEALRLAGTNQVLNTYVAMQGAVAAHAYDTNTTSRSLGIQDSGTPNRYANYYTNGAPCYFASSAGAGTYVNFFNANDYALGALLWQLNQNFKPDNGTTYPGYYYDSTSGFYRINGSFTTYLNFPTNTYEIFAYGDEARCYAIGAQTNVGGAFKVGSSYNEVDLTSPPYNFDSTHKYHSGEFRSDNMQRTLFWNQVLIQMKLK